MLESKNIMIKGGTNVLEAEICGKRPNNTKKIVLICHPHPQFRLNLSKKGKIRGKHA